MDISQPIKDYEYKLEFFSNKLQQCIKKRQLMVDKLDCKVDDCPFIKLVVEV